MAGLVPPAWPKPLRGNRLSKSFVAVGENVDARHKAGHEGEMEEAQSLSPYAAYTDDFGSGNTGSWVRMLVGHTTEICWPAFCITTGVERSFWPASGVPGRKNLTP